MPGKNVLIPEELAGKIQEIIGLGDRVDMVYIDRKAETGESMMQSTEVTGVFKKLEKTTLAAAARIDASGLDIPQVQYSTHDAFYRTYEKTLTGTWYKVEEKPADASANAALFASLGTFNASSTNLNLDVIDPRFVSAEFLAQYKAELIPLDKEVTIDCGAFDDIFFVDYRFNNRMNYDSSSDNQRGLYVDNYVFNPKRGGGQSIETHAFPHYWIRRSDDCTGAVLLGRKGEVEDLYKFAMFSVPQGYSFKAGSNAIHTDAWLHGNYAVSLNIGDVDVVSMRTERDDELVEIKQVKQIVPKEFSVFAPPKFPAFLMRFGAKSTSSADEIANCIETIARDFSVKYAQDEFDAYCKWYRCNRGNVEVIETLEKKLSILFNSSPSATLR